MIGEKKSRGILLSMRPAELQAERVECADHQLLRNCFSNHLTNPIPHLSCSGSGESHGKDVSRPDTLQSNDQPHASPKKD